MFWQEQPMAAIVGRCRPMSADVGRCRPMSAHVRLTCFLIITLVAHVNPHRPTSDPMLNRCSTYSLMSADIGRCRPMSADVSLCRPMSADVSPCQVANLLHHYIGCPCESTSADIGSDVGRCGLWADVGRCRPMWADVGRCWPMSADVGRCQPLSG
jgi:hypothetical protein